MKLEKSKVFTIFGFVSISGPVFGVIFGGWVSSKLGGYNNPKSLYFMAGISIFSLCMSIPIPFLEVIWLQITMLWFMLFCGGMMLPSITGLMLNTVSDELKTTANSFANTCYNLLGFLPSPYIYGLISDIGGVIGANKRNAMKFNMSIPLLFTLLLVYHALRVRQTEKNKVR
jgi:MFS family permease